MKKEMTSEQRVQTAFNRASNLIHALEALAKDSGGKIEISKRISNASNDVVIIETNVPESIIGVNVDFAVCLSGIEIGSCQSTWGTKNRFAVNKAVRYLKREAKAHGMI
jgi:hypothetical protein